MTSLASGMLAASLAITISACASEAVQPTIAPALRPMAFFTGRTRGDGLLVKLFHRPIEVTVESVGRREGDTLILDQTINEGGTPSVRRWTMRPVAANRYSGTLTDAMGDVSVLVSGSRANIHYTTKDGFNVEQQLVLQSDGKTILNRLSAHKLGVRVATLNETIHKLN